MDVGHDDLERALRNVLTDERQLLPDDLVPLAGVHAGALRRRGRRRLAASLAGVVVIALAAPVGLVLTRLGPEPVFRADTGTVSPSAAGTATPTTAGSAAPTTAAPTPSTSVTAGATGPAWGDAAAVSVTATSARTLVTLGISSGCAQGSCLRLARSRDGGRTFTPMPVPAKAAPARSDPSQLTVSGVRFGSPRDGWLFGDGLWATHDGGATWQPVGPAGRVHRLETAGGLAWALVDVKESPSVQLWWSKVGNDLWQRVPGVAVTAPADLAIPAGQVVVVGSGDSAAWAGDTRGFARVAGPCSGSLSTRLSASTTVWATCVTGTAAYLSVSGDGRSWRQVPTDPAQGALPNSVTVGARTPTEAVVGPGAEPLVHLSTTGRSRAVRRAPTGAVSYVGFTTADVGFAVSGAVLWRTEDGGRTWRALDPG